MFLKLLLLDSLEISRFKYFMQGGANPHSFSSRGGTVTIGLKFPRANSYFKQDFTAKLSVFVTKSPLR